MAYRVVFLPSAQADIRTASEWYGRQQKGTGKKFRNQLIKTVDSLLNPLKSYGPVYMRLSRVFVDKFPYVVYFKTDLIKGSIIIYAVLHQK